MVRQQIQRPDAALLHVAADELQKPPRDAAAAIRFLHIDGADVRRQILAVVEVVLNDAEPSGDCAAVERRVPLRNRAPGGEAIVHAFEIRLERNAPLLVKPAGERLPELRPVAEADERNFLAEQRPQSRAPRVVQGGGFPQKGLVEVHGGLPPFSGERFSLFGEKAAVNPLELFLILLKERRLLVSLARRDAPVRQQ